MPAESTGPFDALACLQAQFASALSHTGRENESSPAFRGDPQSADKRLALYRRNLRGGWEKALAASYPVLRKQLGDDFFFAMSGAYGYRFPSQCGDLNRFGIYLPLFLEEFPPAADYPWLPDLARLEWAVHRSHYAADAEPLNAAAVAVLDAGALERLPVGPHPACALLHSRWDIATLWLWHQQAEPAAWTHDIRHPVTALVSRPRWKVEVRALDPGEAAGLQAIEAGEGMGAALEAACAADPDLDVAALFARWLQEGLIVERHGPFKT